MATAKLFIREAGAREFVPAGEFEDQESARDDGSPLRGEQLARNEGERKCKEGNVEAFQVWTLSAAFEREYSIREVVRELVP